MKPRRPALRAYLYEAVLDTFYAPFFVERQNLIELPFQRPAVDIQNDSYAAMQARKRKTPAIRLRGDEVFKWA